MRSCGVFSGILAFLVSVTVAVPQRAEPDSPGGSTALDRAREITLEGMRALYNFQIERACEKFDEAVRLEPRYPRPYYARALPTLWRAFASRSQTDYEESLRLLSSAIEIGLRYLDEVDDEDPDVLTTVGLAYGYRTYIHVVNKSYLKAALDAKKSYDYFTDAIIADPQFYDAYLGLGVYHFSVATISRPLRWLVGILGVEGDRDRGIREIELAARRGRFTAAEAKYFLIQFLPWYKGDFETSERLVDELIRVYPSNMVFLYTKGFLKLRQNEVEQALPYFQKMKKVESPSLAIINKFADYRLGECYFRLGDYARAREHFLQFLEVNNGGQFEAAASLHAGLAAELSGDRQSALPLYRRARNFNGSHGDDTYASRVSSRLLASPLMLVDSLLIAARNLHRCGKYGEAIQLYTDILYRYTLSDDQRAEAVYRTGECLFDDGKFKEAEEQFLMVLDLNVTSERWVHPWAHFMLGQIAMKRQDWATARREFERTQEFDGYDHRGWLLFRTERELERLKDVDAVGAR
jgi:tetratricopeptide (TPR) repeat protein